MLRLSRDDRWRQTRRHTLDRELGRKEWYRSEMRGDGAVGGRSGRQTGWMTRGPVGRRKRRLDFVRRTICKTHILVSKARRKRLWCCISPRATEERSRRDGRGRRRIQGNGILRIGRALGS